MSDAVQPPGPSGSDAELHPYTFATWIFALHVDGVSADDPAIRESCEAIRSATGPEAGNAAGERLVARIRELIPAPEPEVVAGAARKLFGERVQTDLGAGDRAERTARIRKYQFGVQLPWLARIWERGAAGVRPSWLLVERVTDEVTAADPNPWNDVDETRHIAVGDFHVLWELDGCTSVSLA